MYNYINKTKENIYTAEQLGELFENININESNKKTLYQMYKPTCIAEFNLKIINSFKIKNPLDLNQYLECLIIPGKPYVYKQPKIPMILKQEEDIINVGPTSILPIWITSKKANIDLNSYDFITERGNLNKIMQKNEMWKIGIQKIDDVIYLRRYIDRKNINLKDIGYQLKNYVQKYIILIKILLEMSILN